MSITSSVATPIDSPITDRQFMARHRGPVLRSPDCVLFSHVTGDGLKTIIGPQHTAAYAAPVVQGDGSLGTEAGIDSDGFLLGGPQYTTVGSYYSEPEFSQFSAKTGFVDYSGFSAGKIDFARALKANSDGTQKYGYFHHGDLSASAGNALNVSVYIQILDSLGPPSMLQSSSIGSDLCLVAQTSNSGIVIRGITEVAHNVYRVDAVRQIVVSTQPYWGVLVYTGNRPRDFLVTGFQLTSGPYLHPYLKTNGSPQTSGFSGSNSGDNGTSWPLTGIAAAERIANALGGAYTIGAVVRLGDDGANLAAGNYNVLSCDGTVDSVLSFSNTDVSSISRNEPFLLLRETSADGATMRDGICPYPFTTTAWGIPVAAESYTLGSSLQFAYGITAPIGAEFFCGYRAGECGEYIVQTAMRYCL